MKLALLISLFFSTEQVSDSLSNRLEQLSTDLDYVIFVENNLKNLYSYNTRVSFISQSLKVAKKRNFPLSEANAHYLLGVCFWSHANYPNARYHLEEALKLYKELELTAEQAECFNTLGLTEFYIANYSGAITYLDSSLHSFQNQQDSSNIARVLNNLGLVHQKIGSYEKSINYLVDAISYEVKYSSLVDQSNSDIYNSELHNNTHVVGTLISKTLSEMVTAKKKADLKKYISSISELGTLYQLINKHDSAFHYLHRAAEVYDSIGHTSKYLLNMLDIADGYSDLGDLEKGSEIYQGLLEELKAERMIAVIGNVLEKLAKNDIISKRFHSAGEWYKKSIELNDSVGHRASVAKMNLGLAASYLALNETQQALRYSFECKKIAEEINSFSLKKESAQLLSEIYKQIKDFENALFHQSIYIEMALIQKNSDASRIAKELEVQYELRTKAKEINMLDLEVQKTKEFISQQTKYILALIICVGLLTVLFILILRRGKEVRKLNLQIAKRNNENETLLREVHHRVKNNLQMITSLLSMHQRRLKSNDAKNAFAITKNRVKSIGLIHEYLYKKEDFSKIVLNEYIWELSHMIIDSSIGNPKNPKPKLEFKIPKYIADIDTAIPIGVILNELITNSLKHAFENHQNPKLIIEVNEIKDELILKITDNGLGIRKKTKGTGFGQTIVNTLVQNLSGSSESYMTDHGFCVLIKLKDYRLL